MLFMWPQRACFHLLTAEYGDFVDFETTAHMWRERPMVPPVSIDIKNYCLVLSNNYYLSGSTYSTFVKALQRYHFLRSW